MMASNDENIQKLEQALTEAHRARPTPFLGPDWAERVMRDIRRAPLQWGPRTGVEHFVWRTAAIAAALAVIVTASMITWSWTPSSEAVGLLTEEFETAPLFFD